MAELPHLCREFLAEKGIKQTRQRLAVLNALAAGATPMTAEELFLSAQPGCENLSLSTVYRILETLCKHGVVTRSGLMEGGRALFEITPEVHRHNLICIKCHRITPITDCPLSEYESEVARTTGYQISGHKLEVYGICPDCSK